MNEDEAVKIEDSKEPKVESEIRRPDEHFSLPPQANSSLLATYDIWELGISLFSSIFLRVCYSQHVTLFCYSFFTYTLFLIKNSL